MYRLDALGTPTGSLLAICWARVFFLLWPLFARAPRHWFLEMFLLSAPGVQSVFFCCAPLGAATFRRGQSKKKKTPPRVCFFFCSGPGERQGKEKPRWAPARGQSKKKKHHPAAKKTPWVVFVFLLWPRAGTGLILPLPFPGAGAKEKHTLGGVFFFAAAPRGRSLTHCGPGWRCLPLAGVVFVFFAAGRGRTGVVFFFLLWTRPDAHSLTVGWGDFGKARVVFFFLLLRPRRVFLDNNKKCLGYYIGSKKTRQGHSKKKTPLPGCFFFCSGPGRTLTHSLRAWVAMPPPRRGGVCFFCCGAGPDRGGVFFLLWTRPDAHSLTVGWGDFGKARVVFFFFFCCCGPAGSF